MALEQNRKFERPPLTDASTQIRLLELKPGDLYDLIVCEMIVVDLDIAPPYGAISYTWGSPDETSSIQIDGREVRVRKNCQLVLWQVRQHEFYRYYWIDALCIDQGDLQEKSSQVQMMGSIYQEAAGVLVCVGLHADNSEMLFDVFKSLPAFDFSTGMWIDAENTESRRFKGDNASAVRFMLSKPQCDLAPMFQKSSSKDDKTDLGPAGLQLRSCLMDVLAAVNAFSNRPYWCRVWIVQEVWLSRKGQILCGNATMGLTLFASTIKAMSKWLTDVPMKFRPALRKFTEYQETWTHWQMNLVLAGCFDVMDLARITHRVVPMRDQRQLDYLFLYFSEFKCSDPRDRIYGFLSLIGVPKNRIAPIRADYTKSSFNLAAEVLSYIHASGGSTWDTIPTELCIALELKESRAYRQVQEERDRMSRKRFAIETSTAEVLRAGKSIGSTLRADSIWSDSQDKNASKPRRVRWSNWSILTVIRGALSGQLTSAFRLRSAYSHSEDPWFDLDAYCEGLLARNDLWAPQILYVDNRALLLVSPRACPGDVLVYAEPTAPFGGLVVRRYGHDLYGIVGRWASPGFFVCDRPDGHGPGHITVGPPIDAQVTVYYDSLDLLAGAPTVHYDGKRPDMWTEQVSKGVCRQRFSSFVIIQSSFHCNDLASRCLESRGDNLQGLSSEEIELGGTKFGALRRLITKSNSLRRVASIG